MSKSPFFARFLEKADETTLEVQTDVNAGAESGATALKPKTTIYPSDDDQTKKYPFDGYDASNPPGYFTPGS